MEQMQDICRGSVGPLERTQKVSTENDNNFGYEKIMILVDNIPLSSQSHFNMYNVLYIETHIL
jgi:hypothetical protein